MPYWQYETFNIELNRILKEEKKQQENEERKQKLNAPKMPNLNSSKYKLKFIGLDCENGEWNPRTNMRYNYSNN